LERHHAHTEALPVARAKSLQLVEELVTVSAEPTKESERVGACPCQHGHDVEMREGCVGCVLEMREGVCVWGLFEALCDALYIELNVDD